MPGDANGEEASGRDIVLHALLGCLCCINETHRPYDTLHCYSLSLCEDVWKQDISDSEEKGKCHRKIKLYISYYIILKKFLKISMFLSMNAYVWGHSCLIGQ